jgi:hypothetical protein
LLGGTLFFLPVALSRVVIKNGRPTFDSNIIFKFPMDNDLLVASLQGRQLPPSEQDTELLGHLAIERE